MTAAPPDARLHRPAGIWTRRRAFTLAEMSVSVAVTALLMVSIGAAMVIAARSLPNPNIAPASTTAAANALTDLGDDLSCAIRVTERSSSAITFVVADRNDADADPETIRYAWSGGPGEPLTRSYNGGTATPVVAAVQSLSFAYQTRTAAESYEAKAVETAEVVLRSHEASTSLAVFKVMADYDAAQYFKPVLPAGTKSYSVTRALYRAAVDGAADTTLRIQLRTANADMTPSATVLAQDTRAESSMNASQAWYQANFTGSGVSGLEPGAGLCLVLSPSAGIGLMVEYRGSSATLTDAAWSQGGPVWTAPTASKAMQFYVYCKALATPADAANLSATRTYLTGVRVTLNPAAPNDNPMDVTFGVGNEPEILSAAWDADFSADPTSIDGDGDGLADWVMRSGNTLTSSAFGAAGIWSATGTGAIDAAANAPAFRGLTTAAARFQDKTSGDGGVSFRINVERAGGLIAPVVATLTLQPGGTQTLTLRLAQADGTLGTAYVCSKLAPSLTTVRLLADPTTRTVNLRVNDSEIGTFGYDRRAAGGSPADETGASLSLDAGGSAEFDWVSVRAGVTP